MAHNSTITSGGLQFEVTEFDHTAQEIDDSVDRSLELENKTAELENTTVKNTGGILTGRYRFPDGDGVSGSRVSNEYGFKIVSYADISDSSSARNALGVNKPLEGLSGALILMRTEKKDGVTRTYRVFHEGNKPSGSYTGNGDATARTIETGGIGGVISVYNSNGVAIVTPSGAIVMAGAAVTGVSAGEASYTNGKLVLKTINAVLNGSGITTNYNCL